MDADALLRACRPGRDADDALAAALIAQSEPLFEADAPAVELARAYTRRVEHLAGRGLLRSDRAASIKDLTALGRQEDSAVAVAVRHDGQVVTALVGGEPLRVEACFLHLSSDSE